MKFKFFGNIRIMLLQKMPLRFAVLVGVAMIYFPAWANCEDALERLFRDTNINAKQSATEYKQVNTRSLDDYAQILGIAQNDLKRGGLHLDSGGGWGMAGFELALRDVMKSVNINTQNNYKGLIELSSLSDTEILRRAVFDGDELISVNGVPLRGIQSLTYTMDYVKRDSAPSVYVSRVHPQHFPERWQHSVVGLRELSEKVKKVFQSKNFTQVLGYSEDVLPRYGGRVDLLTDVWGAFSYSPARLELLQHYYDALSPNGTARIFASAQKASDTVHMKNGATMPLFDYLVLKQPEIFFNNEQRRTESPRNHSGNSEILLPSQTQNSP